MTEDLGYWLEKMRVLYDMTTDVRKDDVIKVWKHGRFKLFETLILKFIPFVLEVVVLQVRHLQHITLIPYRSLSNVIYSFKLL